MQGKTAKGGPQGHPEQARGAVIKTKQIQQFGSPMGFSYVRVKPG